MKKSFRNCSIDAQMLVVFLARKYFSTCDSKCILNKNTIALMSLYYHLTGHRRNQAKYHPEDRRCCRQEHQVLHQVHNVVELHCLHLHQARKQPDFLRLSHRRLLDVMTKLTSVLWTVHMIAYFIEFQESTVIHSITWVSWMQRSTKNCWKGAHKVAVFHVQVNDKKRGKVCN